jgi:hypothetical protein
MQALEVGLSDVLEVKDLRALRDPQIPMMGFEWDSGVRDSQIIARTIALSIKAVAGAYPKFVAYRELSG